ncbi:geranylgeranyl reductase family protein [Chloroflexota bacterium]
MSLLDVIVIGAGPTGSYLAYKLADAGHEVLVLEREEGLGKTTCCTGIIGRECVNSFPVDEQAIIRWVNSASLFSPAGKPFRVFREEKQACIVDRTAFDLAMAEQAQGRGAQYRLGGTVRDIKVGDSEVAVKVNQQGDESIHKARVAVVAAGFASRLTEKLGMGMFGDFVMGAQTEVSTRDFDEVEVYFGRKKAPGFFAWLVPTSPGKALAGLLSRRSPGIYLRKLLDNLLDEGKIVSADGELSYGGIPLKPLARTYTERLVVVGDAAGQAKPTTGGGIYYGLLCADIAANTLKMALKVNDLSAKNLSRYERGWKEKIGRELRVGYWSRKLYESLTDRQVERIFGIMKSSGIDRALLEAKELSFDWHSDILLRLLGYRVVAKAADVLKSPFLSRRGAK